MVKEPTLGLVSTEPSEGIWASSQAFLVSGKMVRHISCRALQCYRAEVAAFGNFEKEFLWFHAGSCSADSGVGVHPTYRRHSRWLKPEFRAHASVYSLSGLCSSAC